MAHIRFFRRISLIPGWLYLNLSKTGISISLGPRGWTITLGKRGIRFSVGAPGTGVSINEQVSYDDIGRKLTRKSSVKQRQD
ncbi:MAG: DUF4236 domain-containing protein [Hahellaceae bacterium]|nr:DUF4236 domain-containing protein [Hahellaceae bacterium]MCP5168948.1 DUF4236 domain-containing protein [Hahellaceae bacterium]